jgi:Gram-negative bacterial TonB protein C-terminal
VRRNPPLPRCYNALFHISRALGSANLSRYFVTDIVEGGATVLQIHLESIEDANQDPSQFVPTHKMLSHGPGAIMVGPFRFPESVPTPAGYGGGVKPVIVHAILDQKGRVLDAEVVQSSDPVLSGAALAVVWHSSYRPAARKDGPRQREAFINVKFTPPQ